MGSSNFVYDQETRHKATPAQSYVRYRHARVDRTETTTPQARRANKGGLATTPNPIQPKRSDARSGISTRSDNPQPHDRNRRDQADGAEASNPKNQRTDPRRSHRRPKRPMAATARRMHQGQHPGHHRPNRTPTLPPAGPRLTRLSGQQVSVPGNTYLSK
uniref:Uncharacterized protein n=1 Tax=Knipowitschia caucasica TaxID=637954 RepID=A0AAV2LD10_KNICA